MKMIQRLFALLLLEVMTLHAADFLMPDQAFKPYAKVDKDFNIVAGVTIAPEIYLYKDKLSIDLVNAKGLSIKKIDEPASVDHMGDAVYMKSPEFLVRLKKDASVSGMQDVQLKISYQGCSEQGLCYEPMEKIFTLSVDTDKLAASSALPTLQKIAQKEPETAVETKQEKSETDVIADTIKSSSFLVILATFFLFGLMLSLTPCVFPMIPIISGVIISQGEGLTTKKAFGLSLVYVLAMAVAYTIAGVLAGLFGSNLQAALQTPWVVYSFAGIFVVLAFSMFGYYELKLPDALVSKVSQNSNRSGFVGVAIMGFLSALIVGPCVAAPLAGALVYIGQTGDALLGGAALFSMSLGMGLPLILVGVSAGKFMPKPGAWMTMVNEIFGVLMLGVAVWMLEKILPTDIIVFLYAMLGIGFAIYLGAFNSAGHIFRRSVATVLFIYSLALFISVLAGAPSMSKPLGFLKAGHIAASATAASSQSLTFTKVTSLDELNALLEKNKGKKILLDFAAEWCTACKELDEVTFSNQQVKDKLHDFVLIRADVTANGAKEKALSKKYGVFGPPAVLFFNKDGQLLKSKTIIGFVEPDEFLAQLKSL
ncbi:protein-disulfide reductase DsbD [Sulfurimonas paralvinellae]|uniref:Protein-disulfide reductase DsbD n=1 Tax=Sulfurimonas paralvinellae TaxID=317658 RepID=A0A7M1B783_9BACT|nr:protein-disulfide reductase DsbD [Sulfurimonas paralvinellae]QOP45505.1 protein-disulfide reductase DsbD [Sulfurimonas paralvinellae]